MRLQPFLTEAEFKAFGSALAPELTKPKISALRVWLLSSTENVAKLIAFAAARDLLPALEFCLSRYSLVLPDPRRENNESESAHAYLQRVRSAHSACRTAMRHHLSEAVRVLNSSGVEPLLLKGCVSLWEARDPWRQMRDLDILVRSDEIQIAHDALTAVGFRRSPHSGDQRYGHHLPPLVREGMPGWLELHFRASNSKAERYLPTNILWAASALSTRDGARAYVLPAPEHTMHGLVHNHFGHRSSSFGTLNLKGLHEFAWAVAGMSAADHQSLYQMSFGSVRLRAAFELWVSAAADLYHLTLPQGWTVSKKSAARSADALLRTAAGIHESLLSTFIKAASQDLGGSLLGKSGSNQLSNRLFARLRIIGAAAREVVAPWRDRVSLRDKSAGIRRDPG